MSRALQKAVEPEFVQPRDYLGDYAKARIGLQKLQGEPAPSPHREPRATVPRERGEREFVSAVGEPRYT